MRKSSAKKSIALAAVIAMFQTNVVWCGVPSMPLASFVRPASTVFVFHASEFEPPVIDPLEHRIPTTRTRDRNIESPAIEARQPVHSVGEIRIQALRDALRNPVAANSFGSLSLVSLPSLPGLSNENLTELRDELGPNAKVTFFSAGLGNVVIHLEGNGKAAEVTFTSDGRAQVSPASPLPASIGNTATLNVIRAPVTATLVTRILNDPTKTPVRTPFASLVTTYLRNPFMNGPFSTLLSYVPSPFPNLVAAYQAGGLSAVMNLARQMTFNNEAPVSSPVNPAPPVQEAPVQQNAPAVADRNAVATVQQPQPDKPAETKLAPAEIPAAERRLDGTLVNIGGQQVRLRYDRDAKQLVPTDAQGNRVTESVFRMATKDVAGNAVQLSYRIDHFEVGDKGQVVAHGSADVKKGAELFDGRLDAPAGDGAATTGPLKTSESRHLDVTVQDDNHIRFKATGDDARVAFSAAVSPAGIEAANVVFQPVGVGASDVIVRRADGTEVASVGAGTEIKGASGEAYRSLAWSVPATPQTTDRDVQILQHFGIQNNAGVIANAKGTVIGRTIEGKNGDRLLTFQHTADGDAGIKDIFFDQKALYVPKAGQPVTQVAWAGTQAAITLNTEATFDKSKVSLESMDGFKLDRNTTQSQVDDHFKAIVGADKGVAAYDVTIAAQGGAVRIVGQGASADGEIRHPEIITANPAFDKLAERRIESLGELGVPIKDAKVQGGALTYHIDAKTGERKLNVSGNEIRFTNAQGIVGVVKLENGVPASIGLYGGKAGAQVELGASGNLPERRMWVPAGLRVNLDLANGKISGSRDDGKTSTMAGVRIRFHDTDAVMAFRDSSKDPKRTIVDVQGGLKTFAGVVTSAAFSGELVDGKVRFTAKDGNANPLVINANIELPDAQGNVAKNSLLTNANVVRVEANLVSGAVSADGRSFIADNQSVYVPDLPPPPAGQPATRTREANPEGSDSRNLTISREGNGHLVTGRGAAGGWLNVSMSAPVKPGDSIRAHANPLTSRAEHIEIGANGAQLDGKKFSAGVGINKKSDTDYRYTAIKDGVTIESGEGDAHVKLTISRSGATAVYVGNQMQLRNTKDHPGVAADLEHIAIDLPGIGFTFKRKGDTVQPLRHKAEGNLTIFGAGIDAMDLESTSGRVVDGRIMFDVKDDKTVRVNRSVTLSNGETRGRDIAIKEIGFDPATGGKMAVARVQVYQDEEIGYRDQHAPRGGSRTHDRSEHNSARTSSINLGVETRDGRTYVTALGESSYLHASLFENGKGDHALNAREVIFSDHAKNLRIVGDGARVMGMHMDPGLTVNVGIASRGEFSVNGSALEQGQNSRISLGRNASVTLERGSMLSFADGKPQFTSSKGTVILRQLAPAMHVSGLSVVGGLQEVVTRYHNGHVASRYVPQYSYENTTSHDVSWNGVQITAGTVFRPGRDGLHVSSGMIYRESDGPLPGVRVRSEWTASSGPRGEHNYTHEGRVIDIQAYAATYYAQHPNLVNANIRREGNSTVVIGRASITGTFQPGARAGESIFIPSTSNSVHDRLHIQQITFRGDEAIARSGFVVDDRDQRHGFSGNARTIRFSSEGNFNIEGNTVHVSGLGESQRVSTQLDARNLNRIALAFTGGDWHVGTVRTLEGSLDLSFAGVRNARSGARLDFSGHQALGLELADNGKKMTVLTSDLRLPGQTFAVEAGSTFRIDERSGNLTLNGSIMLNQSGDRLRVGAFEAGTGYHFNTIKGEGGGTESSGPPERVIVHREETHVVATQGRVQVQDNRLAFAPGTHILDTSPGDDFRFQGRERLLSIRGDGNVNPVLQLQINHTEDAAGVDASWATLRSEIGSLRFKDGAFGAENKFTVELVDAGGRKMGTYTPEEAIRISRFLGMGDTGARMMSDRGDFMAYSRERIGERKVEDKENVDEEGRVYEINGRRTHTETVSVYDEVHVRPNEKHDMERHDDVRNVRAGIVQHVIVSKDGSGNNVWERVNGTMSVTDSRSASGVRSASMSFERFDNNGQPMGVYDLSEVYTRAIAGGNASAREGLLATADRARAFVLDGKHSLGLDYRNLNHLLRSDQLSAFYAYNRRTEARMGLSDFLIAAAYTPEAYADTVFGTHYFDAATSQMSGIREFDDVNKDLSKLEGSLMSTAPNGRSGMRTVLDDIHGRNSGVTWRNADLFVGDILGANRLMSIDPAHDAWYVTGGKYLLCVGEQTLNVVTFGTLKGAFAVGKGGLVTLQVARAANAAEKATLAARAVEWSRGAYQVARASAVYRGGRVLIGTTAQLYMRAQAFQGFHDTLKMADEHGLANGQVWAKLGKSTFDLALSEVGLWGKPLGEWLQGAKGLQGVRTALQIGETTTGWARAAQLTKQGLAVAGAGFAIGVGNELVGGLADGKSFSEISPGLLYAGGRGAATALTAAVLYMGLSRAGSALESTVAESAMAGKAATRIEALQTAAQYRALTSGEKAQLSALKNGGDLARNFGGWVRGAGAGAGAAVTYHGIDNISEGKGFFQNADRSLLQGAVLGTLLTGAGRAAARWPEVFINQEVEGGIINHAFNRVMAGAGMGAWEVVFNSTEFKGMGDIINPMTWGNGIGKALHYIGLADAPHTDPHFSVFSEAALRKFTETGKNIMWLHPAFMLGRSGTTSTQLLGMEQASGMLASISDRSIAKAIATEGAARYYFAGRALLASAGSEIVSRAITMPANIKTFELFEHAARKAAEGAGLVPETRVAADGSLEVKTGNNTYRPATISEQMNVAFVNALGFLNTPVHAGTSDQVRVLQAEAQSARPGLVDAFTGSRAVDGSRAERIALAGDLAGLGTSGPAVVTFRGVEYRLSEDEANQLRSTGVNVLANLPQVHEALSTQSRSPNLLMAVGADARVLTDGPALRADWKRSERAPLDTEPTAQPDGMFAVENEGGFHLEIPISDTGNGVRVETDGDVVRVRAVGKNSEMPTSGVVQITLKVKGADGQTRDITLRGTGTQAFNDGLTASRPIDGEVQSVSIERLSSSEIVLNAQHGMTVDGEELAAARADLGISRPEALVRATPEMIAAAHQVHVDLAVPKELRSILEAASGVPGVKSEASPDLASVAIDRLGGVGRARDWDAAKRNGADPNVLLDIATRRGAVRDMGGERFYADNNGARMHLTLDQVPSARDSLPAALRASDLTVTLMLDGPRSTNGLRFEIPAADIARTASLFLDRRSASDSTHVADPLIAQRVNSAVEILHEIQPEGIVSLGLSPASGENAGVLILRSGDVELALGSKAETIHISGLTRVAAEKVFAMADGVKGAERSFIDARLAADKAGRGNELILSMEGGRRSLADFRAGGDEFSLKEFREHVTLADASPERAAGNPETFGGSVERLLAYHESGSFETKPLASAIEKSIESGRETESLVADVREAFKRSEAPAEAKGKAIRKLASGLDIADPFKDLLIHEIDTAGCSMCFAGYREPELIANAAPAIRRVADDLSQRAGQRLGEQFVVDRLVMESRRAEFPAADARPFEQAAAQLRSAGKDREADIVQHFAADVTNRVSMDAATRGRPIESGIGRREAAFTAYHNQYAELLKQGASRETILNDPKIRENAKIIMEAANPAARLGEIHRRIDAVEADLRVRPTENAAALKEGIAALRITAARLGREVETGNVDAVRSLDALDAKADMLRRLSGAAVRDTENLAAMKSEIELMPDSPAKSAMRSIFNSINTLVENYESLKPHQRESQLQVIADHFNELRDAWPDGAAKAGALLTDSPLSFGERDTIVHDIFGKGIKDLNIGERIGLLTFVVDANFKTDRADVDSAKRSSLLVQFLLGRIGGLEAGGGKTAIFIQAFGDHAMRHAGESYVGELIVYSRAEVDKYVGENSEYRKIFSAFGLKPVDGRELAGSRQSEAESAYTPEKGVTKIVVSDLHSRGFLERQLRAEPSSELAGLVRDNTKVLGLDEVDALLLSRMSFISSDGSLVASPKDVKRVEKIAEVALSILPASEHTDFRDRDTLRWDAAQDTPGYRDFSAERFNNDALSSGRWYSRHNDEVTVSNDLYAAMEKGLTDKFGKDHGITKNEIREFFRAMSSLRDSAIFDFSRGEKGDEANDRPTHKQGGALAHGQIDSSVTFNIATVILENRTRAGQGREKIDDKDIRLSDAGTMATLVQALERKIDRFGATGTPEALVGLAEATIGLTVRQVFSSSFADFNGTQISNAKMAFDAEHGRPKGDRPAMSLNYIGGLGADERATQTAEAIRFSQNDRAAVLIGSRDEIYLRDSLVALLANEGFGASTLDVVRGTRSIADAVRVAKEAGRAEAEQGANTERMMTLLERIKVINGTAEAGLINFPGEMNPEKTTAEAVADGAAKGQWIVFSTEVGLRGLSYNAAKNTTEHIDAIYYLGDATTDARMQAYRRVDRNKRDAIRIEFVDHGVMLNRLSEARDVDEALRERYGRTEGLFKGDLKNKLNGRYDDLANKGLADLVEVVSGYASLQNRGQSAMFFVNEQLESKLYKEVLADWKAVESKSGNGRGAEFLARLQEESLRHSDRHDVAHGAEFLDPRRAALDAFNSGAARARSFLLRVANNSDVSSATRLQALERLSDLMSAQTAAPRRVFDVDQKSGLHADDRYQNAAFTEVAGQLRPADVVLNTVAALTDFVLPTTRLGSETTGVIGAPQRLSEVHSNAAKEAVAAVSPRNAGASNGQDSLLSYHEQAVAALAGRLEVMPTGDREMVRDRLAALGFIGGSADDRRKMSTADIALQTVQGWTKSAGARLDQLDVDAFLDTVGKVSTLVPSISNAATGFMAPLVAAASMAPNATVGLGAAAPTYKGEALTTAVTQAASETEVQGVSRRTDSTQGDEEAGWFRTKAGRLVILGALVFGVSPEIPAPAQKRTISADAPRLSAFYEAARARAVAAQLPITGGFLDSIPFRAALALTRSALALITTPEKQISSGDRRLVSDLIPNGDREAARSAALGAAAAHPNTKGAALGRMIDIAAPEAGAALAPGRATVADWIAAGEPADLSLGKAIFNKAATNPFDLDRASWVRPAIIGTSIAAGLITAGLLASGTLTLPALTLPVLFGSPTARSLWLGLGAFSAREFRKKLEASGQTQPAEIVGAIERMLNVAAAIGPLGFVAGHLGLGAKAIGAVESGTFAGLAFYGSALVALAIGQKISDGLTEVRGADRREALDRIKAADILDGIKKSRAERKLSAEGITVGEIWRAIENDKEIPGADRMKILGTVLHHAGITDRRADEVCKHKALKKGETDSALEAITIEALTAENLDLAGLLDVFGFVAESAQSETPLTVEAFAARDWRRDGETRDEAQARAVSAYIGETVTPVQMGQLAEIGARFARFATSLPAAENAKAPIATLRDIHEAATTGRLPLLFARAIRMALPDSPAVRASVEAAQVQSYAFDKIVSTLRSASVADSVIHPFMIKLALAPANSSRLNAQLEQILPTASHPAEAAAVRRILGHQIFNPNAALVAAAGQRANLADRGELDLVYRVLASASRAPGLPSDWAHRVPSVQVALLADVPRVVSVVREGSRDAVYAQPQDEYPVFWVEPVSSQSEIRLLIPSHAGAGDPVATVTIHLVQDGENSPMRPASVEVRPISSVAIETEIGGSWNTTLANGPTSILPEVTSFRVSAAPVSTGQRLQASTTFANPAHVPPASPARDANAAPAPEVKADRVEPVVEPERPLPALATDHRPTAAPEGPTEPSTAALAPQPQPVTPVAGVPAVALIESIANVLNDLAAAPVSSAAPVTASDLCVRALTAAKAPGATPANAETARLAIRPASEGRPETVFVRIPAGWVELTPKEPRWVITPSGAGVRFLAPETGVLPGVRARLESTVKPATMTLKNVFSGAVDSRSLFIIGALGALMLLVPAAGTPIRIAMAVLGVRLAVMSSLNVINNIRGGAIGSNGTPEKVKHPHPFVVPVPTENGRRAIRFASDKPFEQEFFAAPGDTRERIFARTAQTLANGETVIGAGRELRFITLVKGPEAPTPAIQELAGALAAAAVPATPVYGTASNANTVSGSIEKILAAPVVGGWAQSIDLAPLLADAIVPSEGRAVLERLGDHPTLGQVAALPGAAELKAFVYQLVLHNAEAVASPSGILVSADTLERISAELDAPLVIHHTHPHSSSASYADRITAHGLYTWGVDRGVIAPLPFLISNQAELTFHDDASDVLLTMSAKKDIVDVHPVNAPFQSLQIGVAGLNESDRPGLWARLRAWIADGFHKDENLGIFPPTLKGEREGLVARAGLELAYAIHQMNLSPDQIRRVWGSVADNVFTPAGETDIERMLGEDKLSGLGLAALIHQLSAQIRQAYAPGYPGGVNMAGAGHLPEIGLAVNQYLNVAALPESLDGPEAAWAVREIGRSLDLKLISPDQAQQRAVVIRERLRSATSAKLAPTLLALAGLNQTNFLKRLESASTGGFTTKSDVAAVLAGKSGDAAARSAAIGILVEPVANALATASGLTIDENTARILTGLRVELVTPDAADPRVTHRSAGLLKDGDNYRVQIVLDNKLSAEEALATAVGRLAHELGHVLAHHAVADLSVDGLGIPTLAEEAWVGMSVARGLRWMGLSNLSDAVELETLEAIVDMRNTQAFYVVYDDVKGNKESVAALVDRVRATRGATRVVVLARPTDLAKATRDLGRQGLHVVSTESLRGLAPSGRESRLETHARLYLGTTRVRLVLRREKGGERPLGLARYADIRDILLRAGGQPALDLVEEIATEKLADGLRSVLQRQIAAAKQA